MNETPAGTPASASPLARPAGPASYGAAFADVYDQWYSEVSDVSAIVGALDRRCNTSPRTLLELGIGSGRLALPLAADGWNTSGIDASPEMLDLLGAKPGSSSIDVRLGDVAEPGAWPEHRFDLVLAAFNLVFNVADEPSQRRLLELAAAHLSASGELVIEADILDLGLEPSEVAASSVVEGVRIETTTDPATGIISGVHRGVGRDRPWRLRYLSPPQLDALATDAGLRLVERFESWDEAPFTEGRSDRHVSFYRVA